MRLNISVEPFAGEKSRQADKEDRLGQQAKAIAN
jgi:hypothetical protein